MNNVLKFDPSKKRKPEPEQEKPKPQNQAMMFVWRSAVVGPMGSALLLVVLFSFSDIWNAITNPFVGGYWLQLGKAFGFAMILGLFATGFSLAFLAPYGLSVGRGAILSQSDFVRRAVMAGGAFGFVVVLVLNALVGAFGTGQGVNYASPDFYIGLGVGTITGMLMAFLWAHVCWLTIPKTTPQTTKNDNR
ncbi:hypothetical protein [Maritalea sp.]|uniref:hypothetical protein n=1 Tax=Maritalea sp. TaxID=2003361 RepID=UPI003EF6FD33